MAIKEHRSIQGQCIFLMELGIKYYNNLIGDYKNENKKI